MQQTKIWLIRLVLVTLVIVTLPVSIALALWAMCQEIYEEAGYVWRNPSNMRWLGDWLL
jgi:hypothetical protein